ncbi:MAG TPA: hypothetical protein VJX94_31055 [Stellaceae bacterium]|nr:hypothetical protein [Stellaceae bacterium]
MTSLRYDTMALKSLDVFSVHGFPVGLVQCESNLLGIVNGNGANVGSGVPYGALRGNCPPT